MPCQPFPDLGVFVRCIIIKDDVDGFILGSDARDSIEKADKFLMPMALHVFAENDFIKNVECGKSPSFIVFILIRLSNRMV